MITYTIYIVDDEESIRQGVSLGLKKYYEVKAFSTAEEALAAINGAPPDLILLDIGLPGMSGIEALEKIKVLNADILVIMVTAYEEFDTVIAAMKLGAHDYVIKPIHMDSLRVSIRNAFETIKMRKEIQALQERSLKENLPCFIGASNAIQDVMQFVDKVAQGIDTPVLISGETGTGKELIASAIHYKSPNFRGPFVTLNCAAIPKDLLESELFGYDKGAFSGAKTSGKKGLLEEAANGTLFLDEVGDLCTEAQAKLLRFLEDGEYYRVGGTKKLRIQTKVVSATNKDLDDLIEKGIFRQDLYYRLAVIKVEVPSLHRRRDDIVPIAKYFLVQFSRKHGKSFSTLSPQTEEFLKNYQWEGNVRELKNLIEKGVLIGNGPELTLRDIGMQAVNQGKTRHPRSEISDPKSENSFPPLPNEGIDLTALEEHYIQEAFKLAGGNETKAARLLQMSYYSFRYRRKKIKDL